MSEVVIDRRFRGPTQSGNGGYACGLLGATLGGPGAVSLRRPPPLDTALRIEGDRLLDGEQLIAEAQSEAVDVSPPTTAPTLEQARTASASVTEDRPHPFPECFVCGPLREPGDGLRIFGAPVDGHPGLVAAWEPEEDPAPEIVWAAMDCITGWTVMTGGPAVLARLAVDVREPVLAGPKIIHAWPTTADGRKLFAEEALYDADGRLLAVGSALWIRLKDPSAFGVNP